eukprot:633329-Prorocentrum_minimum.AAC.3
MASDAWRAVGWECARRLSVVGEAEYANATQAARDIDRIGTRREHLLDSGAVHETVRVVWRARKLRTAAGAT